MSKVREGYKMTELGEIPSEWEVLNLNNVAEVIMGQSPNSNSYNELEIGLPFYQGKSEFGKRYPTPVKWCSEPIKIAEKNDVLISVRAPVGEVNICQETSCIGRGLGAIRATQKSDSLFLYYSLLLAKEALNKKGQGSTFTAINGAELKGLTLAVPSKVEQQKIASILSTVDEQIDETEQLIVKTKELKKGLMQQLLTKGIGHTEFKQTELGERPSKWEVKALSSLGDWTGGGTPSKSDASNWSDEQEVLWVTSTDMHKSFISETALYITEKGRLEKNLRLLPVDTLIFVMRSGILKRYLPVALAKKELTINQDQKAFICKENCTPLYIYYTIQAFNKQLRDTYVKTGTTVESIDFNGFKQLKLAIPKLEEQQKIAQILSTVDEQIEVYEQEKAKYEELKKGLMQQLLTGQIRVKI